MKNLITILIFWNFIFGIFDKKYNCFMKLYFIHIFCNKMNYEHILFKMKKFELFRHDATISKFEPDTVNLHFNLSIFIDNE